MSKILVLAPFALDLDAVARRRIVANMYPK